MFVPNPPSTNDHPNPQPPHNWRPFNPTQTCLQTSVSRPVAPARPVSDDDMYHIRFGFYFYEQHHAIRTSHVCRISHSLTPRAASILIFIFSACVNRSVRSVGRPFQLGEGMSQDAGYLDNPFSFGTWVWGWCVRACFGVSEAVTRRLLRSISDCIYINLHVDANRR